AKGLGGEGMHQAGAADGDRWRLLKLQVISYSHPNRRRKTQPTEERPRAPYPLSHLHPSDARTANAASSSAAEVSTTQCLEQAVLRSVRKIGLPAFVLPAPPPPPCHPQRSMMDAVEVAVTGCSDPLHILVQHQV
ncbi:hypothetical protein CYMTET_34215, partial [Cymbomonas tetramitiformis]